MSQSPLHAAPSLSRRTENSSNEFDLLCACASVHLSPARSARVAAWNESAIDWDEFLRLAEHHGALPLAAGNLRNHAHGVPAHIEQSLRTSFDVNLRRNLWFTSELLRITEQFEASHVRAIPYKGPVLAELVYGDVALRNFGDLDFLISAADFELAKQALAELGYQPSRQFRPAVERYGLRYGYERSFDSAAGKYLVELQWGLLPRFYSVDLTSDDLFARSRPASLGGRELPGLSPEDLLLVLCLHSAKHLWTRLIWVCDIAETIQTQALDWELLCSRARHFGILRIMGVSFWLADRLLDCPLPDSAREIMNDPAVSILGEEFAARLGRGTTYDFESSEYFRLILKLRERRCDQARYLWRLFSTPGDGDLAAIKLPEAMFPLYRAVRAVRLMRKLF